MQKSIKNSQPFVKKMKNVMTSGGGDFFTHTVGARRVTEVLVTVLCSVAYMFRRH